MSHADVLACDGDQQKRRVLIFQNMEGSSCVDLLATYRLVDLRSSISNGQKREIAGTGCSTLSHNTYCDNSGIDGVLESSLRVKIYYNLLCIRPLCFFVNQAWILF